MTIDQLTYEGGNYVELASGVLAGGDAIAGNLYITVWGCNGSRLEYRVSSLFTYNVVHCTKEHEKNREREKKSKTGRNCEQFRDLYHSKK